MTEGLFPLVLAGHLVGDFIVQTDWMAMNKETNWRADLLHAVTYTLAIAALVVPFWFTWEAGLFLLFTVATHALIDRRWPTRWVLTHTRSKGFSTVFWGIIATDQALHVSLLAISLYLLRM